jgi:hypothetical protein
MSQPQHHHHVRRVVLPSGKTIEVIYFEDFDHELGTIAEALPTPVHDGAEMHHCGTCSSELVYPLDWNESGPSHWEVMLRCPNCEWCGTGVFSQDEVERFDEHLDGGTEQLVHDMQALSAANTQDEIERFVSALASDLILPEDF